MRLLDFQKKHPEHVEEAEERAAIMEYDGRMDRTEAEEKAVSRMYEKYKLGGKGEIKSIGRRVDRQRLFD